jgi:hypothetical protein
MNLYAAFRVAQFARPMPIASIGPVPTCYFLFSRTEIAKYQWVAPDLFSPRARAPTAKQKSPPLGTRLMTLLRRSLPIFGAGLILAIVGGAAAASPDLHSNAFADKFFTQGLYEALEKLE